MKNYDNQVAGMLKRDLKQARLTQGELAAALSLDAAPITPQAISIWQTRGRIPKGRVARLREVLGAESEIAKASDDVLCGADSDGSAPVRTYQRRPVEVPQARTTPALAPAADPMGLRPLLPAHMHDAVGHLVNFGRGVDFVLTYTSERVLAVVQGAEEPTGEALSDLATLATHYPGARALLVLVQPEGLTAHPRARFKAAQLGIDFEVVRAPAEAAALLVSLEREETY